MADEEQFHVGLATTSACADHLPVAVLGEVGVGVRTTAGTTNERA
jgi:hypothetical protein